MPPLLGQGRIVDDQPGSVVANQSVRLGKQRCLKRSLIPEAAANEVMNPGVVLSKGWPVVSRGDSL